MPKTKKPAEDIFAHDQSNLRQIIYDTSNQIKQGVEVAKEVENYDKVEREAFDSVVICGMGGSAMPGYLMRDIFEIPIPLIVHTNYGHPPQLTPNPLFVISSFSGNTEETLASYDDARKNDHQTIVFTNGGQLAKRSREDGVARVEYGIADPNFQPRYALFTAFACMTSLLEEIVPLTGATKMLEETRRFAEKLDCTEMEGIGRQLAETINGNIPIFYTDYALRSAAHINKIKINENAKQAAFWNHFPELNHNEYNGYQGADPKRYKIIMLKNDLAHPRNQKRMTVTTEILRDLGFGILPIDIQGKTLIEKIYYSLHLGDWIAYYLAILNGRDPTPVPMIETLKKQLK